MNRWRSFVIGAATFAAIHGLQAAMWRRWFDPAGSHAPWFLNNGRAATLVVVALFIAAAFDAAAGRRDGGDAVRRGCWLAAGAFTAMSVVLILQGPGTIFPIVLVFGALLSGVSGVGGAVVGTMIVVKSP